MEIRITDKMDHLTVKRSLEMVGKQEGEWNDNQVGGLVIRIRKTGASWSLRSRLHGKLKNFKIGHVQHVSLLQARERANHAKLLLKRGEDPTKWLLEELTGGQVIEPPTPTIKRLTFADALRSYLSFIEKHRSKDTLRDYRTTLKHPYFDAIQNMEVTDIRKVDIRKIQERFFTDGKATMSNKVVSVARAFFSWLVDQSWTELDENPCLSIKKIDAGKKNQEKKKIPELEEIGRLPWILTDSDVLPRTAIMLMLMTGQRMKTVLTARKSDFINDEDGGIYWQPSHMKSNREHPIPVSDSLWNIVKQAMVYKPKNPLLFPKTKVRSLLDDGNNNPISYKIIYDNMRGCGFKPHDIRRAFATHGAEILGIGLSDIKTILDHSEGRGGDVTLTHYQLSTSLKLKKSILDKWQNLVVEQVKQESENGQIPLFMQ